MGVAADDVERRTLGDLRGEPQQRRHDPADGAVDVIDGEFTARDGIAERQRALLPERHLDVEPGADRLDGVTEPEDEVGDDESVPAPLLAEDVGQEDGVLSAPLTVDRVVGAHHRSDALGGDALEVRQVHLVERSLAHGHVDREPGVLHRVQREVLHARHHVTLQAAGERRGHHPDMVRILAVGLLGATPRRVAEQVHAHRAGERRAAGAEFGTDRLADPLLQVGIERRTTGHAHRERGGVADHAAARSVGELDARNPQPPDHRRRPRMEVVATASAHVGEAGPERCVAVQAAELLLERHRLDQRLRLGVVVGATLHAARSFGERIGSCRHVSHPATTSTHPRFWLDGGVPNTFLHPFAKPTRGDFVTIARGEGALLWDSDGNELIDAMASLWYCNVGHGRAEIADAVAEQIRTIETYSCFDPFTNAPAEQLADRIVSLTSTPEARVFFAGSGSEAVDSAMKLARLTHVLAGRPERRLIISRVRGYHGTNYGGTSAQGLPLNKEGYGELLADVVQVPSDDIEALSVLMAQHSDRVAAVLTEPVQGAAGVYPPADGYLEGARHLCDQHGALLIFDEVITGFGRLGSWFAAQHYGVQPDMTTFAKAVTSGYQPLGGVIVGAAVRAALEADPAFILRHGYTYSGHASACAAGLANLAIIERENLVGEVERIGTRLGGGLRALADDGVIDHVRGDGAIYGVGLRADQDASAIRDRMQQLGVVVRAIGADTLDVLPAARDHRRPDRPGRRRRRRSGRRVDMSP